jgi:hypothetical protein
MRMAVSPKVAKNPNNLLSDSIRLYFTMEIAAKRQIDADMGQPALG